ncbi:hypothetical protein LQW54_007293 [Pestalotiopsis sp. IQ-011]
MDSQAHNMYYLDGAESNAGLFGIDHSAGYGEVTNVDPSMNFDNSMGSVGHHGVPKMPDQTAAGLPMENMLPKEYWTRRPSFGNHVRVRRVSGTPERERVLPREGMQHLLPGRIPKKVRNTKKWRMKQRSKARADDDKDIKEEDDEEEEDSEDLERSEAARVPINSQDYYGKPGRSPEPWGWRNEKNGHCTFRYNELGEFAYNLTFCKSDLQAYFDGQPPKRYDPERDQLRWVSRKLLPDERIRDGKKRSGLTLWIGWTPAQANDRYPNAEFSNVCRFRDCPVKGGTFRGGYPRVAFDERLNTDEQHFDIIKLMEEVDVRLDTRVFAKEDNLASFQTRQEPDVLIPAARDWLSSEWARKAEWDNYLFHLHEQRKNSAAPLKRAQTVRPRSFDDSLTKKMVETDSNNYSQSGVVSRQKRREAGSARGEKPLDASEHLGNIEYFALEREKRGGKKKAPKKSKKKGFKEAAREEADAHRNNEGLLHRVYEVEHFTSTFVPGRQGPSDWDALGRPGPGFQPRASFSQRVIESPPVSRRQSRLSQDFSLPAPVHTIPMGNQHSSGFVTDPPLVAMPPPYGPSGYAHSAYVPSVQNYSLLAISSILPTVNEQSSDFSQFLSSVPIDQPLADLDNLLSGNQTCGSSNPTSLETRFIPTASSHQQMKRAREEDNWDDLLVDQAALESESQPPPRKRARANSDASEERSSLSRRRRSNSIELGRSVDRPDRYAWEPPASAPVVYVNHGDSPVDFSKTYNTLSVKRKHDDDDTHDDSSAAEPPHKRSRTDAFRPSQLAGNISPIALTPTYFDNLDAALDFTADGLGLADGQVVLPDSQLDPWAGLVSGPPGDLRGAQSDNTADWFDLQMGMNNQNGPLPSLATVEEAQQAILDFEDSILDEYTNASLDSDEARAAEPPSQPLPSLSSVLDIQSDMAVVGENSNGGADDADIDALFDADSNTGDADEN